MEGLTGEEAALREYVNGAAGESAAAMVLWSPAAWTEAGETGGGLRRHGSNPLQYNSKLKVNRGSCQVFLCGSSRVLSEELFIGLFFHSESSVTPTTS